jgi:hypothetical protein
MRGSHRQLAAQPRVTHPVSAYWGGKVWSVTLMEFTRRLDEDLAKQMRPWPEVEAELVRAFAKLPTLEQTCRAIERAFARSVSRSS